MYLDPDLIHLRFPVRGDRRGTNGRNISSEGGGQETEPNLFLRPQTPAQAPMRDAQIANAAPSTIHTCNMEVNTQLDHPE